MNENEILYLIISIMIPIFAVLAGWIVWQNRKIENLEISKGKFANLENQIKELRKKSEGG